MLSVAFAELWLSMNMWNISCRIELCYKESIYLSIYHQPFLSIWQYLGPIGWIVRIPWVCLCRVERLPNESTEYDMKPSDHDTPVLDLWGMWSNPTLPLLPSPLWPGPVVPDRVLSMAQIEISDNFLYLSPFNGEKTNDVKWNNIYHGAIPGICALFESHTEWNNARRASAPTTIILLR